jgi:hypothetical protein
MIKAATNDYTKGWPFDAHNGFSPEVVQEAVKCPYWQKVRLSMKGKTTKEKLRTLLLWRQERTAYNGSGRDFEVVDEEATVQIDNYLGALRRGGQLDMNNLIQR